MINKSLRLIRALLSLFNPRAWGPFTEAYEATRFDHAFSVSWSQSGEDLALLAILGKEMPGRYLDIGAHHPSRFSVTRHLYQRGWNGVNVDGNSDLIRNFDLQRKRDVNLNFCIGTQTSYLINIFAETAISTVSSEWKDKFLSEKNSVVETRKVKGKTLHSLIIEYFPEGNLKLLNLDIEGADLDALTSGNFKFLPNDLWPEWILLEANAPFEESRKTDTVKYLADLGYLIYLVLPFATLMQREQTRI